MQFSVVAKYGSKLTFLADIVIGTIPFYDIYALSLAGSKVITKQPPSMTISAAADGGNLELVDHTMPSTGLDANDGPANHLRQYYNLLNAPISFIHYVA